MPYPLGGIEIENNDPTSVDLFDTIYKAGIFDPTAADTLYLKGMVLARDVAGAKWVPYVAAAVDATAVPLAVLGDDVLSDAGPADVNLRAIVSGQVNANLTHTLLAPTAALTVVDEDRLQSAGIIVQPVLELHNVDNPQP